MMWIPKTIYQGCIQIFFVSSAQYNALDIFLLCTSNYCTMEQLYIYETKHAIVVKTFLSSTDKTCCYYFRSSCSGKYYLDSIMHFTIYC